MTGPNLLHQAMLFGSDDEFAALLVPFVRDGLRTGDHVVAVTSPDHIGLLRTELDDDAAGVRFIEADNWYQVPVTALAAYDRYLADHTVTGRVRLIGEAVWPELVGWPGEWPQYESVINVAFAGAAAWIVCPYDTRLAPDLVDDARRTHPELAVGVAEGHPGGVGAQPSVDYLSPLEFHRRADSRALAEAPTAAEWSDFGPRGLREVRARVTGDAEAAGLRPDRVAHLVCAVNEVATNAVQHGGGAGVLRCWTAGQVLVCEVASYGVFTAQFPGYLPPRRDVTSGRGLWLARQLCDLVEIRTQDGRSLVRLTIRL